MLEEYLQRLMESEPSREVWITESLADYALTLPNYRREGDYLYYFNQKVKIR